MNINNRYVAHMSGDGEVIDGRRDASEEGRPMGNQYASTTHPNREGDYTYPFIG